MLDGKEESDNFLTIMEISLPEPKWALYIDEVLHWVATLGRDHWLEAMDKEMTSLQDSNVWELVEPTQIRSKWAVSESSMAKLESVHALIALSFQGLKAALGKCHTAFSMENWKRKCTDIRQLKGFVFWHATPCLQVEEGDLLSQAVSIYIAKILLFTTISWGWFSSNLPLIHVYTDFQEERQTVYLGVYMDDIVVAAQSDKKLCS